MAGPIIAFLTVMALFGIVLIVYLYEKMEIWAGKFYTRRSLLMQIVLFIPFALLWCFFRLVDILVLIGALITGYQVATGVRNWWNKRPH